jgi:guanylate cyclase
MLDLESEVTANASYWERLNARAPASGVLATIEDPATVARLILFTMVAATVSTAGFAVLYLVFDEPVAGWVTMALAGGFLLAGAWYLVGLTSEKTPMAVVMTTLIAAANHVSVHLALGGYANSGAYLMWGVAVLLTSSLTLSRRVIAFFAVFYGVTAVLFGFLESTLRASRPAPDPTLSTISFVSVLIGSLLMLVPMFGYFLQRLANERARSEALLLNVLPAEVAGELKRTGQTRARRFDAITILFADTAGFTPLTAEMESEAVVAMLNEVFTRFDVLSEKYGCEKIRTIGDAYMVASGLPVPRPDQAQAIAALALEMLAVQKDSGLQFRIGINSGPAAAGVIGTNKFQYDVWGDTVNTASRMESHGEPGRIQISETTYELIKDDFVCIPHGPLEVKGKGTLNTWFLEGVRELTRA